MATVTIGHIPVLLGPAARASYCMCTGTREMWAPVYVYVHVHVRFVSSCKCVGSCVPAYSLWVCLCVAWLCTETTLSLEELVRASHGLTRPWHCYGSMLGNPFIRCHAKWPPSIEKRGEKKDKLQEKQQRDSRKEDTAIHEPSPQQQDAFLILYQRCNEF